MTCKSNEIGPSNRKTVSVLGAYIDVVDYRTAVERIQKWASDHESQYVCICNAHSVVTTTLDPEFFDVVGNAAMVTPDGSPVAWMMRQMGIKAQERVNGPDLMWLYFYEAAKRSESVYLYGSSEATLKKLTETLMNKLPGLQIAGHHSPPFRELTEEEDMNVVSRINASGAGTVWVSLGCPKQEKWMAAHKGKVSAVMIGVGAAFDYHAGTITRAPLWMQERGLEWLHRLCSEPRRLWRRYFVTNTLFVVGAIRQLAARSLSKGLRD